MGRSDAVAAGWGCWDPRPIVIQGLLWVPVSLALMWVLVSRFEIHYAIANVLAVLSLSIVNFLLCDRFVFRAHWSSGNAARVVVGSIIRESTTMATAAASIGAATNGCSTTMSAAPPPRIKAKRSSARRIHGTARPRCRASCSG